MEYDMNRIRKLCEKYYDAETSAQEEKILREYFTHAEDIPDSLKSTKVMICGLVQASEAEYTPEGRNARGRLVRRIAWSSVSIAASIAICIALFNRESYGYDTEGKAITDPKVALEGTVYLSYLSQLETTIDIAEALTKEMEDNN